MPRQLRLRDRGMWSISLRYLFAAVLLGIMVTQSLHRSLERSIHERIEVAKGERRFVGCLFVSRDCRSVGFLSCVSFCQGRVLAVEHGKKQGCLSSFFLRCFIPVARRAGKCSLLGPACRLVVCVFLFFSFLCSVVF